MNTTNEPANPCDTCGGSGQVEKVEMHLSGMIRRGKKPCPDCS